MKFKKVVKIACVMAGVYWVGKLAGVKYGAKAVLNKYDEIIPDNEIVIELANNALVSMTAVVKKGSKK